MSDEDEDSLKVGKATKSSSLVVAEQTFFINLSSKQRAQDKTISESESMRAIHSVLPGFVPRPRAWGACSTSPNAYRFLSNFRDLIGSIVIEAR
ncbi:hypothetical protein VUR80DRAFT_385 [Thermomyces stellatus]